LGRLRKLASTAVSLGVLAQNVAINVAIQDNERQFLASVQHFIRMETEK
jgi:hypothetical protein